VSATRIDPDLDVVRELTELGAGTARRCSQCATCSVVCDLSGGADFPRKKMLWAQWGLKDRLLSSIDPWLCYYCGKCSTRCPRGAEPGEVLMSLRRWLTSHYDFTGISRLFYRSWKAELAVLLGVAVATAIGFLAYGFSHGDLRTYDGPTAFLPSAVVHRFDWAMAGVLVLLLSVNVTRMWWFALHKVEGPKVPLGLYLKRLHLLPLHFITQRRFAACDSRGPWLLHMVLMASYLTLLTLIMGFLHTMQAGPEIRWSVHLFGYAASVGLLTTVIIAIRGRLAKVEQHHRHSHESDWLFLVLLLMVTLTGVAQHVLHRTGQPIAANIVYVVHLAMVVPMLLLEVPFGKWSHMVYRPLAAYFAALRSEAIAACVTVPKVAAGGAEPAESPFPTLPMAHGHQDRGS
jgi:quinone-modifying oxidoreductase subunit QmoC